MIALVCEHYKTKPIRTVWHPDAKHDLMPMGDGVNLRVLVGPAAYQTSDGHIVTL